MQTRRQFLVTTSAVTAGSLLLPSFTNKYKKITNAGVQLYTFRKEMLDDAKGTLQKIAALGIKQIESAASIKGHYYGLSAKEMKEVCTNLGMTLRSGHVQINDKWEQTMNEAAEAGQEYLVCSVMPTHGQTADNYKKVAEVFNKAGEACKKLNIKFGYHNHGEEFEMDKDEILYDILLKNTDAGLVHMEMDLGWVVVAGKNPLDYFEKYPGRFPLWHLKDMKISKKISTEFGKGDLDIVQILKNKKQAGLQYYFIEQEEYSHSAFESMEINMEYLKKQKIQSQL